MRATDKNGTLGLQRQNTQEIQASAISQRADSPVDGYLPPAADHHKSIEQHKLPSQGDPRMFLLEQRAETYQDIIHYELSKQLKVLKDRVRNFEIENNTLREKLRQHARRAEKNALNATLAAPPRTAVEPESRFVDAKKEGTVLTAQTAQTDAKPTNIDCKDAHNTTQTTDKIQDHVGALLISAFLIASGLLVFSPSS